MRRHSANARILRQFILCHTLVYTHTHARARRLWCAYPIFMYIQNAVALLGPCKNHSAPNKIGFVCAPSSVYACEHFLFVVFPSITKAKIAYQIKSNGCEKPNKRTKRRSLSVSPPRLYCAVLHEYQKVWFMEGFFMMNINEQRGQKTIRRTTKNDSTNALCTPAAIWLVRRSRFDVERETKKATKEEKMVWPRRIDRIPESESKKKKRILFIDLRWRDYSRWTENWFLFRFCCSTLAWRRFHYYFG